MSHSPGTYVPSTLLSSLLCMSLLTQREMRLLHTRQVCTEPLLHIGHSFVINLPFEARKCVLGLDRRVSDPDIGVGPAPAPTRSSPTHCGPQFAMSSSPLSVASSVPSGPSLPECGWGDLPELLRFGDQRPSPPWDSDAEKCLSKLASP